MDRIDLFRSSRPAPTAPTGSARRPVPERLRHWNDLLPWRASKLSGSVFVDPFETEVSIYAVCGRTWTALGERLKEELSEQLASGRLLLRIVQLRHAAPSPVPGARHLSCRRTQLAREILRHTDAAGRPAPWDAAVLRKARSPLGPTDPHGTLKFTRGLFMAWPGGAQRVTEWPPAVPIVIGESTAPLSWELLAEHGALAVWIGVRVYLFRQVRGAFPAQRIAQEQLDKRAS